MTMTDDDRQSNYDDARLADRRAVAMNVTELRVARGLSQADLGHRAGGEPPDVADVEAGAGEMLIDTLSLLADGLNVDIARLFRNRTDSTH